MRDDGKVERVREGNVEGVTRRDLKRLRIRIAKLFGFRCVDVDSRCLADQECDLVELTGISREHQLVLAHLSLLEVKVLSEFASEFDELRDLVLRHELVLKATVGRIVWARPILEGLVVDRGVERAEVDLVALDVVAACARLSIGGRTPDVVLIDAFLHTFHAIVRREKFSCGCSER